MSGYRGVAGVGHKVIDGKKYSLWGWLTSSEKRSGDIPNRLRKRYKAVRVLGSNAPFAVWVREFSRGDT
jgi:hypothetical protein